MEQYRSGRKAPQFFSNAERLAVFIDGSDFRLTAGGLGIDVDFKKLIAYFRDSAHLVRAHFYFVDRDDEDGISLRPLTDWLDYNGYTTIACSGSDSDPESPGRRRNKNFLNVQLTVDVLEIAPVVDHVVIFTGDAVLAPLVDALKWRGRRVSIISTLQLRPPMVADGLRRRADQFIDIADIVQHVAKESPAVAIKEPVAAKRARRPARSHKLPLEAKSG